MADYNVSDVASKVNIPNQMSLADMINMARNVQSYQQAQQINPLLLQQQQAETRRAGAEANVSEQTQEPRISTIKSESNIKNIESAKADQINKERLITQNLIAHPEQWTNADGQPDLNKAFQVFTTQAPLTGAETVGKIAETVAHKATADNATLKLNQDTREKFGSAISAVARSGSKNLKDYIEAIDNTLQQYPNVPSAIHAAESYKKLLTNVNPKDLPAKGIIAANSFLTPAEALPKPIVNAAGQIVIFNPLTTEISPPSSQGMSDQGGDGGKGLGINPTNVQIKSYENEVANVAEDYKNTVADATPAAKNIGLYQKLIEYSKGASTGAFAKPREFLNNVAQTLSIKNDETATDTQLLDKISAQLALQGGKNGTDFATLIRQAADPNKHMTLQAIDQASKQYIGQEKLKLVKQAVMQQYQTNPEKYSKALVQFNQIADPNVLQWNSMSDDAKRKFRASMSEKEWAAFKKKGEAMTNIDKRYNLGLM